MDRSPLRYCWNINTEGQDHENAVTASVRANDAEAVRFLIEHGGRVTEGALRGSPDPTDPLHDAVALRLAGRREESVRHGPAPDCRVAQHARRGSIPSGGRRERRLARPCTMRRTPLMAAVDGGSLEVARLLLVAGADARVADDSGHTAIPARGRER